MLCPDWCELLLWILMIHLLMETMKASRIITHMRSLQQMLHSDHCDMPSSMCPRTLICQCLEFFEQVIDAWGSVYSSYKYGQTRRKCNCIMHFHRGLLELLGDARVQDFKKCKDIKCGNVIYFEHWQSWVEEKRGRLFYSRGIADSELLSIKRPLQGFLLSCFFSISFTLNHFRGIWAECDW